MWRYANPYYFMRISRVLTPIFGGMALLSGCIGVVWSLFFTPEDFRQADAVRIMFIHVPSAFMSTGIYTIMAVSSFCALIWRHVLADVAARCCAPLGCLFTFLTLITGAIWGKPIWGAWWVWDARLTSIFILSFVYIGYMALRNAVNQHPAAMRVTAIYCLTGAIMVPIIKYSVYWWRTLHQPASLTFGGEGNLHSSFFLPLLMMIFAFSCMSAFILLVSIRREIRMNRIKFIQASG
jgi:heme exporter protein C